MQKISPLLQQSIANQQFAPAQTQIQAPVDLSQKPDTVELSNKETETKPNKKKIAKYAAIAFGAAAAIAGIVAIAKGKAPADISQLEKSANTLADEANKILPNAQEMQKEAQNLADEANKVMGEVQAKFEKIKEEVISLFNNEGKKDGIQVAAIEKIDNSSIMKEFGSDGALVRKSEFVDSELHSIEEITQNGINRYSVKSGNLSEYKEGVEDLPDGTEKWAKTAIFENGKLAEYYEGTELLPDGTEKCAKTTIFENGKLAEYYEGTELLPDETVEFAKLASFENGKLAGYSESAEVLPDGTEKWAKTAIFENGKLAGYSESGEALPDGIKKVAKMAKFINGELAAYGEGGEALPDGIKYAKIIKKNGKGKWVETAKSKEN